ncbi:Tctex1 domain-containing protein 1 [Clonorchis sinensis]|uniref:Tctex1 domain-containing protein 1 n=1 Tax=Clonorchis sinensis TaxID=79923 RepID=A0A8T1M0Z4_CLOSI|nr:Tctex1 domain-containing protein 1 [Clonorchis sinensis]
MESRNPSIIPKDAHRPSMFPRRVSKWSIGSRKSLGRSSLFGIYRVMKSVKYENTYRTGPKRTDRISEEKLKEIVNETMVAVLESEVYNPQRAQTLSVNLSNQLRKYVHEAYPKSRYKIIAQVTVGSPEGCSIIMTSRALWNPKECGDTFVEATFSNTKIFAVALVFCLYYE